VVGKAKGMKSLGRPWNKWEYSIKIDLRIMGLGAYGVDSTGTAFANRIMDFGYTESGRFLDHCRFFGKAVLLLRLYITSH
jgi:hypothetical protein